MSEDVAESIKLRSQPLVKKEKEQPKEGFYQLLIKRLKKHQRRAIRLLKKKHAATLVWLAQQKQDLRQLKSHAATYATTGTVAVALFAATTTPLLATSLPNIPPTEIAQKLSQPLSTDELIVRLNNLRSKTDNQPKDKNSEMMAALISDHLGITARVQLDGHRLNRVMGVIGAEQHLRRYPGDTISAHLASAEEKAMFAQAGIAYHKSAYGYFANSKAELTEDLALKEKYYLAVQTFLIPEWHKSWAKDKDWFKFRKVLVFNPENGREVVAVIADAGPAAWTGKHFGGSPEVMHELDLSQGSRKGEVIVLFIDDPQNQIALGPISQNKNLTKEAK